MPVAILITLAVLVLALGLFAFRAIPGIRAYFACKGKRLITCPETHETAAVDVSAGQAAVGAFLAEPTLRLKECSRWPEREDCGQECLSQIEVGPPNCLVWNIVSKWYEEKKCAFCQKPIGALHHLDHAPALIGAGLQDRRMESIPTGAASRFLFQVPARVLELSRRGDFPSPAS